MGFYLIALVGAGVTTYLFGRVTRRPVTNWKDGVKVVAAAFAVLYGGLGLTILFALWSLM